MKWKLSSEVLFIIVFVIIGIISIFNTALEILIKIKVLQKFLGGSLLELGAIFMVLFIGFAVFAYYVFKKW